MLISPRHRLVVLAVPRCASTALHAALAETMEIAVARPPRAKHTTLRSFNRHLRPWVEGLAGGPVEVVALVREPIDWLGSWWRYRQRPGLADQGRSTVGMAFDAFVAAHLDDLPGPARVGRQARFLAPGPGPDADRVFARETVEVAAAWLADRLGTPVALPRLNAAPGTTPPLPEALAARARRCLAADAALHAGALRQVPSAPP